MSTLKDPVKDAMGIRAQILAKCDLEHVYLGFYDSCGKTQAIQIHKALLCHFSEYFCKYKEDIAKNLFMTPSSPRTVQTFKDWLCTGTLSSNQRLAHASSPDYPDYVPTCNNFYNNLCQHDLIAVYTLAHDYDVRRLRSLVMALLQDEVVLGKRNSIEIVAGLSAYERLPHDSPLIRCITACVVYGWPKYFEDAAYMKPKVPPELLQKLPRNVLMSVVRKQVAEGFGTSGIKFELERAMFEGITAPGLYEGSSNVFRPDEHALHEHETDEELQECEAFLASDNHGMGRWIAA
ncbi:hypothetical protein NA57DRAFT_61576 [Rhizodiscina lignyota]|uniref:BTB domain-containing protein n=1 Tax=Rhizodiscina lignyota TaxID=1504668 RepID=A0A9P4M0B8_9PEZI|nr:hypothetical protein NA57DRAFT_61576 [Rhizodiscina lignyota]